MFSLKQKVTASFAGEYCCRKDHNLTFVSDPAELAVMFGYSAEEMRECVKDGLLSLTDEDARDLLRHKLRNQLMASDNIELTMQVRRKDGTAMWVMNRAQLIEDESGECFLCGLLLEITLSKLRYDMEKETVDQLQERVQQDSLTKVYNASTARELSEEYLGSCQEDTGCALLIVDLDNFKQINDHHGHMFGDVVLVQCAQIIRKLFRTKDIVGRIGGDEFLVLMKDIPDQEIVKTRCRQINEILRERFEQELPDYYPSCSIGVAFAPEQGKSYFQLFCCADQALYHAKESGRRQYAFYEEKDCGPTKDQSALRFANYDESVLRGCIE